MSSWESFRLLSAKRVEVEPTKTTTTTKTKIKRKTIERLRLLVDKRLEFVGCIHRPAPATEVLMGSILL